MPIDADLLELMSQTVDVEPCVGQNVHGEASYGPPVRLPARVVDRLRLVRDAAGKEMLSTTTVYVGAADPAMSPGDRVTLPDGRRPPILAVARYPDEEGGCYQELYLGAVGGARI